MITMNTKKLAGLTVLMFAFSLLIASSAQAVFMACFHEGAFIDFCNPNIEDRTVGVTTLMICMSDWVEESSCYVHASPNACNALPPNPNGQCSDGQGGNGTIDIKAPTFTLNNPKADNNSIFKSATVLVDYNLNEESDTYYMDLLDDNPKFRRICQSCNSGNHKKNIRFNEGLNKIRFKSVDNVGNTAYNDTEFFIDSKAPKVTKNEPKTGFADGTFDAEYSEENPITLELRYGDAAPYRTHLVDLDSCSPSTNGRMACTTNVDLSDFNNMNIKYWFNITDIAGSWFATNQVTLGVDTSAPIINNIDHEEDGKSVMFELDITETNFASVMYIDTEDEDSKWKSLCSKLTAGICSGKATLNDGHHTILFNVTDKAGNHASQNVSFYTDSQVPKIKKTDPKSGFTNGAFDAQIVEANPTSIYLNFGNQGQGFGSALVDSETECSEDRGTLMCSKDVDLSIYNGQLITYWFNVTDILDQKTSSKPVSLSVDTVFPLINDLDALIDGNKVTFVVNVAEINLDLVEYMDTSSSSPKFRSLCTKLTNGICQKTISFQDGHHDITIQVSDKAGNAIGQGVSFDLV